MTAEMHQSSEDGSFHLLTIGEYATLGEAEHGHTELVEGRLIMSPSPVPDHDNAAFELAVALRPRECQPRAG